jgi:type III secretion protein C
MTGRPGRDLGYTIDFPNVSVIEFIRFISKISGKNFVFDEEELNFNVTIVSTEPTSLDNIMALLLHSLQIRGLTLLEQGNNIIIHQNADVKRPARVVTDAGVALRAEENELVTQVYRLNFADPARVAEVLQPLVSKQTVVQVLEDSRHIIVTDLATNMAKVTDLVQSLDQPNTALDIGQYVAQNLTLDSLVALAEKILRPIAGDTPLVMTPQTASNSIFVISTPYFVQRAMTVLETLDVPFGRTRILSFDGQDRDGQSGLRDGESGLESIFPEEDDIQQLLQLDDIGDILRNEGVDSVEDLSPSRRRQILRQRSETFGRFRDPREFQTPDLFFDFGDAGMQAEFELPDSFEEDLPIGHIDTTHFFIHKLEYRKGDSIQQSLSNIADSLALAGTVNIDLLSTIASAQWIETSNSIIFTGTRASLDKVKELIQEVDTPLRQVLVEMLIIETTLDNSLNFGVEVGSNIQEPEFGGNFGFYETGSALATSLAGVSAGGNVDATGLVQSGLTIGAIGKNITHNGTAFESLGVLLKALSQEAETNVVMNPKIVTEDNVPAEIFVGTNERFNAQSIASESSTNVTTNFEFRDVGSTLRVTPLLGTGDIVTLEIEQEISTDATSESGESGGSSDTEGSLGPVTRIARTNTRVHIPDRHFLIISGMITDNVTRSESRIPCIGTLPLIGSALGDISSTSSKRNLMIFIRPSILDTIAEMREATREQQDLFREKSRKCGSRYKREMDGCLQFLNLR